MTRRRAHSVSTITFLALALLVIQARPAAAIVEGTTPSSFDNFQVFGDGIAIGNSLMENPPPALVVNTELLSESSANLMGIPADANPEAVYLWWSGSLAPGEGSAFIDDDVLFTAADGATLVAVADSPCQFITTFPVQPVSFYYCRADITTFVTAHPGMFSWNGTYTVGDVYADPGHTMGGSSSCLASDVHCQAKYAAWSMIFVYDSPSATLQRDIFIYDGFVHCDENAFSIGTTSFTISGFNVGTPAEAEITYFGMEGDQQLGAGPGGHCDTCPDFFAMDGTNLTDGFNPPGNSFNSSDALGLDIDEFSVGTAGGGLGILDTGDTSVGITTGTGEGLPNFDPNGESIFLGWVFLRLNRPSPNFRGPSTTKIADRASAATGETISYTVNVANQGSLVAHSTVFTDVIPAGMSYQPDSLSIDGIPCTDAADADLCSVSGGTITIALGTVAFTGDNDRLITFRTTLTATGVGTSVCNVGSVTSTETPTPAEVGPACTTVATASLGQPLKSGLDLTGGLTGPDDVYQYTITIPGDPGAPVSGVTFQDDMPPHVQLLSYTSPGGSAMDQSLLTGGVNGNGRVRFTNVNIPVGGTVTINITVQVDSEAEFVAAGIPASSIHGTTDCNQGEVTAGFLPGPLFTDNPGTAGPVDSTCFTVSYAPIFSASSKGAVDEDGGNLEPNDTILYTITLVNSGNRNGTVTLDDSMPAAVENFVLVTPLLGATFTPPPAGTNGTGRFQVAGLSVVAGATVTIQFRVTVQNLAADGTTVVNSAIMSIAERPEENRTLISPSFVVYARPELGGLTKAVTDVDGGSVEPGDTLSYTFSVTNTGNRPATDLVMTDVVDNNLTNVVVTGGGGVFDVSTRTITWTLASLDVAATFTASFTADVVTPLANGTVIPNQAAMDSAEPAPGVVSDDPATAAIDDPTSVVVVSAPNLTTSVKTVVDLNGGQFRPGDTVEYSITVTNTGSEIATSVVITDAIDVNLGAITPLDGGVLSGSTITWAVGAVAPGSNRLARFQAAIATPLLDGTLIANQGSITTPELASPTLTDDPATPASDDPTVFEVESQADLTASTITFEDLNGGAQQPGDQLRYTVHIVNNGDSPATSIVAQVAVDPRLTGVVAETGGAFAGGVVTWNVPGALDPGDPEIEVTFVATIMAGLPDGEIICEDATIDSTQSLPFTTPEVCFTVESRPDLAATEKTVVDLDGGDVQPGDSLQYTITIRNEGNEEATGVTVADVVPLNLTSVVPLDGGVLSGGTITWSLASVPAGGATPVRFNATVATPLDDGTEIANQATVMCGNGCPAPELSDDPTTPEVDDPTIVTIRSAPVLAIAKTFVDDDGGLLDPGDAITYTLAVTNTGDSCADAVVVTDVIDVDLGSVVPEAGGTFDSSTSTVTWNGTTTPVLVRLCPGTPANLIVHATVDIPLPDGTPVCNQGQVVSQEVTVPALSNDPSTPAPNDATCRNVVSGAVVSGATKSVLDLDGGDVRPGDTLRYTISFTNEGNADAVNVTITDPVASVFTTVTPANGGVFSGGVVTWNSAGTPALATVNVGENVTVSFDAVLANPLANGTVVSNQATISAAVGITIPQLTDDPATAALDDPTSVTVVSESVLIATKTVVDVNGGVAAPGDLFEYTVFIVNQGDDFNALTTITDVLDPNLTFVEVLDGGTFNVATQTITWTVGPMSTGAGQNKRFRATADSPLPDGTIIANQATFIETGDPVIHLSDDPGTPAPDDPTLITIVAAPDLTSSTKTVAGAGPGGLVAPGTTLNYTITVINDGDATATGVVVTDPIDTAHLDNIAPLDGGTLTGSTITWSVGSVFPGVPVTRRFNARVRFDVPDDVTINNQATVTSVETPAPALTDDPGDPPIDDPTEVITDATPDLGISKTVADLNGLPVAPGDTLTYSITIDVRGPAHAYDIVVSDPIPPFLTNVMAQNGGIVSGGTIQWLPAGTPQLQHVAPGAPVTLTFTANVVTTAEHGDVIPNQATVVADGLTGSVPSDDPLTPTPLDPTVVTVVAAPIIVADKTVVDQNGGFVLPGDVLSYTITVANEGTAAADNVRVLDTIPPQTDYVQGSSRLNGSLIPDVSFGDPPMATPPGALLTRPLAVGETTTWSFEVTVNQEALVGTILSNQAFVSADGVATTPSNDPATGVAGDATQVVVGGGALLSAVSKFYDPIPVGDDGDGLFDPGEIIQYHVTIQNTGTSSAKNVVFTDAVPSGADWVAGSLRLDGQTITDTVDGDSGEVAGGMVTVRLGNLPPGSTAAIDFRMRVLSGVPSISNQGQVDSDSTPLELTDADGNDGNGDQPTITGVGNTPSLSLIKTVADLDGGTVDPSDQLFYTLGITNTGTSRIDGVVIEDDLPPNVTYVPGSTTWPGSPTDPFIEGKNSRGTLNMSISIGAGETVLITYRVVIDDADKIAANGAETVCNLFDAVVNIRAVISETVCIVIGSYPGAGRLRGRSYVEGKVKDRSFQAEQGDTPMKGLALQFFRDDGLGTPMAGVLTDDEGKFKLDAVPPGDYLVRAFSSHGTQLAQIGRIQVGEGGVTEQDVWIDPSGVVYDSLTGNFIQDVKVFLFYDEEDDLAPGQLVPANRLAAGQQGQLTTANGIYKFDVADSGRKYRLVIDPATTVYAFPSQIIPATPGFAPPGYVVDNTTPSLEPNAVRTYYLRFDIEAPGDDQDVLNNHVPLDTLSSQVKLDKRSDRPDATLGEIVNYTITVKNKSTRDLTAAAGEPVWVVDAPERGLSYLKGQAAAQIVRGTDVQRLIVGRGFPEQILGSANGRLIKWGPFDLAAGATLTLHYQVVVGLETRPGTYKNVAVLEASSGEDVSNTDSVELRVKPDPIFDEGVLVGKVFCDKDGDGRQDKGEKGIYGARVYIDTGSYVKTDLTGKWHLSAIDPGMHMVKIDKATLPAGSTLTTPESEVLYITRGLGLRVNFGAKCVSSSITTEDQEGSIKLSGKTKLPEKPKPPAPPKTSTTITGELPALAVAVDGKPAAMPQAQVDLWVDTSLRLPPAEGSVGINLAAPPDAGYAAPMPVFQVKTMSDEPVRSWTLTIWRVDASGVKTVAREMKGQGAPPGDLPWDGKGDDGKLVPRDAIYVVQLAATFGAAGAPPQAAASSRTSFGVAFGVPKPPESEEILRGDFFAGSAKKPKAKKPLITQIGALAARIGPADQVVIEVHGDGTGQRLAMIARTQKQAEIVRGLLIKGGVSPDRIKAKGRGSLSPLVPNAKSKAGKATNRRIVVKITPPPPPAQGAAVPAPAVGTSDVMIAGQLASIDEAGRFVKNIPTPPDGLILIDLVTADGRRSVRSVTVPPPPGASLPGPVEREDLPFTLIGDTVTGAVTLAGQPLDTSLLSVDVGIQGSPRNAEPNFTIKQPPRAKRSKKKRRGAAMTPAKAALDRPIAFDIVIPTAVDVGRWSLTIRPDVKDAKPIHSMEGAGAPGTTVWNGEDDTGKIILATGTRYLYRLVVEDAKGSRVETPTRAFTVGVGAKGAFATLTATGKLFTGKGDPGGQIKNRLAKLKTALKKRPVGEKYKVEIAVLPKKGASESEIRMAVAVRVGKTRAYLNKIKLPLDRIDIVATPVDPALPKKQQKDKITITAVPPVVVTPTRVVINGQDVPMSGETFSQAVKLDADQPLMLDVTLQSGHRAVWVIPPQQILPLLAPPSAAPPVSAAPPGATPIVDGGVPPLVTSGLPPEADNLLKPGETLDGGAARVGAAPDVKADPDNLMAPGEVAARALDRGPTVTLSLADDPGEFGGEQLENALADPESVAARAAAAEKPAKSMGRLVAQAGTGVKIELPPQVTAADLTVNLPPRGLKLHSPDLWVSGRTFKGDKLRKANKLRINGRPVELRPDGTFDELITLPLGASTLVVEAIDADENIGMISWPVVVTENEHFLLLLADGAASTAWSTGSGGGQTTQGAELDGMNSHSTLTAGHVLLHGRVALYYKGRMKGGDLFKQYKITAHVDTAKQPEFEEFFQNTLDPTRDYAVYGDAAEEVRDANARGKIYVMVEADESKALVGNFKTSLQGGELFRYDRTVYGAQVDIKKQLGSVKQEIKAFGTTGDGRLARDVNLFRATGGSLYYLRHGRVVEGGERIRVIVRDRDNGLLLVERVMTRDIDYAIDYVGGRIMFREPIASTSDSAFLIDNLDSSQTPLDGHPVYVEASYEYEPDEGTGGAAGGAYVKDTLFETLAIGAGVVGESRDGGGLDDYSLMGADLTWKAGKRSTFRAEVARSESTDAGNWISQDGGLSFQGLNAVGLNVPDANRGGRMAWKLELDTQLGDFAKSELLEATRIRLYGQKLDRGFFSGGSILEQGRTKYGGQISYRITQGNVVTFRHDAEVAELPRVGPTPEAVAANPDPLRMDERASVTSTLQYHRTGKKLDFKLEGMRQALSSTAALVNQADAALDTVRWGAGLVIGFKWNRWLTTRVGQEFTWIDGGTTAMDPVLDPIAHSHMDRKYENGAAGIATTLGVDLRLAKDTILSTTGAIRWNGDTALQAGLKTAIGDSASMYANQRLEDRGGNLVSTSIVGGEERFGATGKGGKAYGEYQLESGMLGVRNRAVLGVGHKWSLARGWSLAAGYEHQQTFGGYLPDGTPTGENRRDVVHLGSEFVRPKKLKLSALFEVRLEDGFHNQGLTADNAVHPKYEDLVDQDPRGVTPPNTYPDHGGTAPGSPAVITPGERVQIVAGAAADWKWTQDQTFLLRFRLSHTEDTTNEHRDPMQPLPAGVPPTFTMARFVEATAGWAYRPLQIDWFDMLFKYSFLLDLRPIGLNGESIESQSHVISFAPIIDLPMKLQLSAKFAWKRTMSEAELIQDQELSAMVDTFLWLTRLGYRFYGNWDVAMEYRYLALYRHDQDDGTETKHGFLFELDYNVTRMIRLGAGYNFSHFSDDELGDLERDTHGLFFRVVGRY